MKFVLILQNNASKQFYWYKDLENVSLSHLYIQFDNIELDVPSGEYTYVVFENSREDIDFDFKNPILDSIILTNDGDIKLEDIHPRIGLLRVGLVQNASIYDKETNLIFYED